MSPDPEKPKPSGPPESPTTARELDFDDDPSETPGSPTPKSSSTTPSQMDFNQEAPPPKPPRPTNPQLQAEATLKEAFPTIDVAVIKAVLRASGGNVEPAFNALLEMTDPEAQQREPTPPPQPPRRTQTAAGPTTTAQSQLAADEQYARQLAEHYSGAAAFGAPPPGGQRGGFQQGTQRQRQDLNARSGSQNQERERNFIDDDLPEIRDNIKKGFIETQSKVSSWVTNLRKKIDGDDDDEDFQDPPVRASSSRFGFNQQPSYGGRRSGEYGRRSSERDRYDADPQVLGDDFAGLQMRDNDLPPRSSSRPKANPDLFKPMPRQPSAGGRRVSFQDGPPEEIGVTKRASSPSNNQSSGPRHSKWQPLTSVEPSPVTDHDPFSLGDSDDEEPNKPLKQENIAPETSNNEADPDASSKVDSNPAENPKEPKKDTVEESTVKS